MRKLYEKNEVLFAVVWILVYCFVMAPIKGSFGWDSIWMLLLSRNLRAQDLLSRSPLPWLGGLTMGIFVIHTPVYALLDSSLIPLLRKILPDAVVLPLFFLPAVGLENLADPADQDYALFSYLASAEAKLDKLYEVPELLKTPIVRNGKQATVGYCPEVWKDWK